MVIMMIELCTYRWVSPNLSCTREQDTRCRSPAPMICCKVALPVDFGVFADDDDGCDEDRYCDYDDDDIWDDFELDKDYNDGGKYK